MAEHVSEDQRSESREQRAEALEHNIESQEQSGKRSGYGDKNKELDGSSIESIRQKIEESATKAAEVKVDSENTEADIKQPLNANRELKSEALRRTLNRTRKHLSKPQRALSKVIHQPAIDAVSKVGEKTIARPTGLLTGSIIALAGSSYLLYSAKHYGYEYNYLSVLLLFVSGYVVGLVIELLVHALHHHSK
ncbi:MAG TPA: hypothetical protein VJC09_01090 [Candidatus Saccharimonadales bacterium]|nr:hypothetical protein [Candidatus Saccharimonadales bacterium]